MTKIFEPVGPEENTESKPAPIAPRLAWFMGIAVTSGAVVILAAYILRGLMGL